MRQLVQRLFLCLGVTPEWEFDRFCSRALAGLNALRESRMREFDVGGARVK